MNEVGLHADNRPPLGSKKSSGVHWVTSRISSLKWMYCSDKFEILQRSASMRSEVKTGNGNPLGKISHASHEAGVPIEAPEAVATLAIVGEADGSGIGRIRGGRRSGLLAERAVVALAPSRVAVLHPGTDGINSQGHLLRQVPRETGHFEVETARTARSGPRFPGGW